MNTSQNKNPLPVINTGEWLLAISRDINIGDKNITAWTKKNGCIISHQEGLEFIEILPNGRAHLKNDKSTGAYVMPLGVHKDTLHGFESDTYKVLACLPLKGQKSLPNIPLLPKIEDDASIAARKEYPYKNGVSHCIPNIKRKLFIEGYKANNKLFTLEQISDAVRVGVNIGMQNVEKPKFEGEFNFNQDKAMWESLEYLASLTPDPYADVVGFEPEMEALYRENIKSNFPVNGLKTRMIDGKETLVGKYIFK